MWGEAKTAVNRRVSTINFLLPHMTSTLLNTISVRNITLIAGINYGKK